jgi:branched-subunit amino acid transport protein
MIDSRIFIAIAIMAIVTYIPRMLPLVFMKKPINHPFLRSFLHYVPYAVLAAMTFPAIVYSTQSLASGFVGLLVALALAFYKKGLLTVALGSTVAVFFVEQLLKLL